MTSLFPLKTFNIFSFYINPYKIVFSKDGFWDSLNFYTSYTVLNYSDFLVLFANYCKFYYFNLLIRSLILFYSFISLCSGTISLLIGFSTIIFFLGTPSALSKLFIDLLIIVASIMSLFYPILPIFLILIYNFPLIYYLAISIISNSFIIDALYLPYLKRPDKGIFAEPNKSIESESHISTIICF